MNGQHTLLTSHKGVDLHAATALRVMLDRLEDGDRLVGLARAEYATYWEPAPPDLTIDRLLTLGRYFNPNKHHFGHFWLAAPDQAWFRVAGRGEPLPASWPGQAKATDQGEAGPDLYDRLLGGPATDGTVAVDVCTFPLGDLGPLLNGVLWRLFLREDGDDPLLLADRLAVTRHRGQGLLVNPHMQGWRMQARREDKASTARQAGSGEGA